MAEGIFAFGGILNIAVLIVLVLWFILPFAIFGTKPRIDKLIDVERQNNGMLGHIANNQAGIENRLKELIRLQRKAQGLPEDEPAWAPEDAARDIEKMFRNENA